MVIDERNPDPDTISFNQFLMKPQSMLIVIIKQMAVAGLFFYIVDMKMTK